ncbi:hypothetical protein Y032_0053g2289 [Ancylostoma ceylanicum]|uniref:Uncharacterized protein n=1 Tax=Ancylostoma ceylanicum TaxID=53326 RepID=A0A016U834_9BILA|nr:hypothetical protein Y032_0053g2289 [Ancylostoma ceylanicum]
MTKVDRNDRNTCDSRYEHLFHIHKYIGILRKSCHTIAMISTLLAIALVLFPSCYPDGYTMRNFVHISALSLLVFTCLFFVELYNISSFQLQIDSTKRTSEAPSAQLSQCHQRKCG